MCAGITEGGTVMTNSAGFRAQEACEMSLPKGGREGGPRQGKDCATAEKREFAESSPKRHIRCKKWGGGN